MFLVNYKNESTANVSEYYMLEIYPVNTKHLCRDGALYFFKTKEI